MKENKSKYDQWLWYIIGISFIVRFIFSYAVEFGNDEVYYWLLSSYPALSYFDHPPLLFAFINLFTFGHSIDAEWAIRLPSLIAVSISTWLLYDIGKTIKSARTGFIAALLAQCSFYIFIIGGFFVIPDGVLGVFWLAALRSAIHFFDIKNSTKHRNTQLLLFGLFIGLGAITKYHILILWASFGLFVLYKTINQKSFFKQIITNYRVYISFLITVLAFTPVIIWNINNDFASLKFHESRLSFFGELKPLYFMREVLGQFVYNNFFIYILALVSIFSWKKRKFVSKDNYSIILWFSLPLILAFLFFSLFRATFPHWSAPGYYLLIVLAAAYLDELNSKKFVKIIPITVITTSFLYVIAFSIIQTGIIVNNSPAEDDVTLDMYGWTQMGDKIIKNSVDYPTSTKMVIANKWYNAAHIDYYMCRNSKFELMCVGTLSDIHEYERINKERGFVEMPKEALFIQPQREGRNPVELYKKDFSSIQCIDTIPVYRGGKLAQEFYVFLMKK